MFNLLKKRYVNNPKIAFLLFGQPRFVGNNLVKDFHKRIIDSYETDVYAHVWFKKDFEVKFSSWAVANENQKISIKNSVPDDAINKIISIYNPKKFLIKEPEEINLNKKEKIFLRNKYDYKKYNERNLENIFSQLKAIQYVSNILPHEKYDFVIMTRYDAYISNFPKDLRYINPRFFYVGNIHPRFPDMLQFGGVKYLNWFKEVYNITRIDGFYNVSEPSCENLKLYSYLKFNNYSSIKILNMKEKAIRE